MKKQLKQWMKKHDAKITWHDGTPSVKIKFSSEVCLGQRPNATSTDRVLEMLEQAMDYIELEIHRCNGDLNEMGT